MAIQEELVEGAGAIAQVIKGGTDGFEIDNPLVEAALGVGALALCIGVGWFFFKGKAENVEIGIGQTKVKVGPTKRS